MTSSFLVFDRNESDSRILETATIQEKLEILN